MSNSLEKGAYPLGFTIGPLQTRMPTNLISFVLGKPDHYKRRCLKIIVYPVCAEYVSQTFYSVMFNKIANKMEFIGLLCNSCDARCLILITTPQSKHYS
jgi:hypothetical protein